MIKILRLEQWSKNVVILLPPLFAKKIELLLDKNLLLIFLGFSILASSTYIFNDLKDLDQDRLHPTKKNRPLPKGDISVKNAKKYGLILYIFGCCLVYIANNYAIIFVLAYSLITVLYSEFFKYRKYFDFCLITILFGVRLFLGSYVTEIALTNTLSLFTLTTINIIILSKKISIFADPEIDLKVRVKSHLVKNYTVAELRIYYFLSSSASILILLIWTIQWFELGLAYIFLSILNFFSLCLFNYRLYQDAFKSETEDFISWLRVSKIIYLFIFSGLSVFTLLYL
jgi:4-hydroxybenzoate polyprenyltransferase